MNILYRGDWKPPEHKFECGRCGTVWECAEQEVQKIVDRNELYTSCICPICGKRIMKYECRCVVATKETDESLNR